MGKNALYYPYSQKHGEWKVQERCIICVSNLKNQFAKLISIASNKKCVSNNTNAYSYKICATVIYLSS